MGRDYGLTPEPLCLVLSLPRKHTLTDQQLHTRLLIRSRNSTSLKPTRLLTRFLLFLYTPHHFRNAGSPRITSTNVRGNLWTSGKLPRDRGKEPSNARLLPPQHVHFLRDPHANQHSRLQAAPFCRAPPLLRF